MAGLFFLSWDILRVAQGTSNLIQQHAQISFQRGRASTMLSMVTKLYCKQLSLQAYKKCVLVKNTSQLTMADAPRVVSFWYG